MLDSFSIWHWSNGGLCADRAAVPEGFQLGCRAEGGETP